MTTTLDNSVPTVGIGSDMPLSDPGLDEFGYSTFAKVIAAAIAKTPTPRGLVMSIHGEWGSGKSTLLNFVKHHLTKLPNELQPVVIDFNPWWFEGHEQLASQFLAQFKSKLGLETKAIRDLGDMLAKYSGVIGKAMAYSTGISWLDKAALVLRLLKRKPNDVPKLKEDIAAALKKGNTRYLIVIDDIDRLTPGDIRELFKVVKALADFPNVVYVLSFDRAVVAKALSDSMGFDGEAYLEKIIQVPFILPAVARENLRRKLTTDLDKLIGSADLALFDKVYWGNIFWEGIFPSITKPRDVVRYINALSVTYPPLQDEVNITDFFALELIRIALPNLYITIRENPERFVGYAANGIKSQDRRDEYTFHQAWADEIPENLRPGIQAMLQRIFPRLDNMGRGSEFLNEWRRLRRAASPDVFPHYFRFTIDADQLSRRAILDFIDGLSEVEGSKKTLLDAVHVKHIDGTSKAKDYLAQLIDFNDEIDHAKAVNLITVLAQIGDKLIVSGDEENYIGFPIRGTSRVRWVIQHALARIPEDARDSVLIIAFGDAQAISCLCHFIEAAISTRERPVDYGPSAVLTKIGAETVEELKGLALSKIQEVASAGSLLETPELFVILRCWRDWGDKEEAKLWAEKLTTDANKLLVFLTTFLAEGKVTTIGDVVGRSEYTLDFKFLADFCDLERVSAILSQIDVAELADERQRLAAQAFLRQHKLFKEGKHGSEIIAQITRDPPLGAPID